MSLKGVIAKNIRTYRKKARYSQKELASLLNLSSASISNWEKEANSIDIDTLNDVCKILNVTISEMLDETLVLEQVENIEVNDDAITISLSKEEQALINNYRMLNSDGQEELLDQSAYYTTKAKYKKRSESINLQEPEQKQA